MNFTIPEKQKVGHHVVSSGVNSGTAGGKAVCLSHIRTFCFQLTLRNYLIFFNTEYNTLLKMAVI